MVISNFFLIIPLYSLLSVHCFDLNPESWWSKSPVEMETALVSQTGVVYISENLGGILGWLCTWLKYQEDG